MAERTKYQQSVIRNFYQNREAIAVQRLQEIVSELYLAQGKKLEQQWKLLQGHLEKLGLPRERIEYLLAKKDPALIATVASEFFAK